MAFSNYPIPKLTTITPRRCRNIESIMVVWLAVGSVVLFSLFLWKYPTFFRDARIGFINYKVRLGVDLIQLIKGNFTLVDQWEITVAKHQDRPCIVYEGETLTFKQVEVRCNQYAHWALDHGFIKGDVIALFLPNSPDFFAIWMGLAKVGVESAFLNNNIRGASLLHGIKTCKARAVIVNQELLEHLTPIQEELQQLLVSTFTISGEAPNSIKPETRSQCAPPVIFRKNVTYQSPLYYIFTSGTTGLPKAAIMKHKKSMWVGYGYAALFRFTKEDRLYITLPQYHSAATTVGFGIMITSGCAIVLRKKFSATRFWKDVVEEDVTVFQYVGELCRYLCNTPTSPFQQQHKLRLAFGNGLRPDVWDIFRERFKIPQIGEFYASTEGNVIFVNRHNVRHSVGFAPCVLPFLHCARIIRYNIETDEVYTDANGYCQEAAPNEVGLLIGKMSTRYPFDGYVGDKSITNKKILRNVFSTGDSWFNTGDLFKEDQYRNMYFMDRIGDTFRWKGENVATTEVAQAISSFQQVEEVNAYGVQVPGHDGRAGMVALVCRSSTLDLEALYQHICVRLPAYARPLFIRIQEMIETTGTFKHIKTILSREGFDPSKIKSPLYFCDPSIGNYVPLDNVLYDKIVRGQIKL